MGCASSINAAIHAASASPLQQMCRPNLRRGAGERGQEDTALASPGAKAEVEAGSITDEPYL
jgi:hypothetical protein